MAILRELYVFCKIHLHVSVECATFAADLREKATSMKDFRLDNLVLSQFKAGTYEFDYVLDTAYFQSVEKSEVLDGNVAVHSQLTIGEDDYRLRMTLKGQVYVTCDRCLEPMVIPVECEEMIEDEEQTLDLLWTAYETVTINLPMVHCHPDGGCNPEMAALLQSHLRSTEEEPEEI